MEIHGNRIDRPVVEEIKNRLLVSPAVALLGARQVGKTTLAKAVCEEIRGSIYLDLERPSDLRKLEDPQAFLAQFQDSFVCMDEIQRMPDIFPLVRSEIDRKGRNGQFLFLGSASRDLIRQGSETLAGRLSFFEITPFHLGEVGKNEMTEHWLRGGYPRSFLASGKEASLLWREDYIRSFLERDIPQLGFNIPANTLGRFWRMLAHSHGQLLNASKLAGSMGVSDMSVRKYIDLLEQTFVIRTLAPFEGNVKKRLIKSPKVYVRDSGLLHALLEIESHEDLYGHPIFGHSFEGYVVENVLAHFPRWRPSFYRTSNGAEIDLILERGQKRIAIEIKASAAPKLSRGFHLGCDTIGATARYAIAMVEGAYELGDGTRVVGLGGFLDEC